jgi:curved DNA-binding protein CbpA
MPEAYIDPYAALEIARDADQAEVRRAYVALVRSFPPEREPERFKQIRTAYERLRDPAKRLEADMLLLEAWPESTRKRRAARLDLQLQPDDLFEAARILAELYRSDWREHYGKVKL